MGFLAGIAAGLATRKGKGKSGQQDTSKPFHTHSSSSGSENASAKAVGTSATSSTQTYEPRSDGGQQKPVFMGKGQTEKFESLTDPSNIDRSGRAAPRPDDLDNVGIEPAMNPPMGVPVENDLDKEGTMNSLYS